jgi:C-terminal processing protease CtpA/Prc
VSIEEIGITGQGNVEGLYVTSVRAGSPAANAGIVVGDTVVRVNGSPFQLYASGLPDAGGVVVLEITKAGWLVNQTAQRRVEISGNAH